MTFRETIEKLNVPKKIKNALIDIAMSKGGDEKMLENVFEVLGYAKEDSEFNKKIDNLFVILNQGEYPNPKILELVWNKLSYYFSGETYEKKRLPLYEVFEDLELLNNYLNVAKAKSDKIECEDRQYQCLLVEIIEGVKNISDDQVIDSVGVSHALYDRWKRGQKIYRRFISVMAMENEFKKYCEKTLDQGNAPAINVFSALTGWYKFAISLGGTFNRHCLLCNQKENCKKTFSHINNSERNIYKVFFPGVNELESIKVHERFPIMDEEFIGLFSQLHEFVLRYMTFVYSLDKPIEQILEDQKKLKEKLDQLCFYSRIHLDKISEEKGSKLWVWFIGEVLFVLDDVKLYFQTLEYGLKEVNERIYRLDSEDLLNDGLVLIESITIEEVLDMRANKAKATALLSDFPDDSESVKHKINKLLPLRQALKSQSINPKATVNVDKLEEKSKNKLAKIYKKHYSESSYMNMSYRLKVNLIGQYIKELQKRLAVVDSANLIDTYCGKRKIFSTKMIFWFPIPIIVGFILSAHFDRISVFILTIIGIGAFAAFCIIKPNIGHGKIGILPKEIGRMQFLPEFVVPIILSLTPFVLSDELKTFVFNSINKPLLMIVYIVLFSIVTCFSIWKLQEQFVKKKIRNMIAVFSILWPQSFIISLLIPLALQNHPETFKVPSDEMILHIPRVIPLFKFDESVWYAYPCASLVFSVLCLFAAVFIEGLYRKQR